MRTSDQVCSWEFLPNSEYLVQVPDFYKTAPWGGSGLAYNLRIGCRIPELFPGFGLETAWGPFRPRFRKASFVLSAKRRRSRLH
jgi:hypothetical protein